MLTELEHRSCEPYFITGVQDVHELAVSVDGYYGLEVVMYIPKSLLLAFPSGLNPKPLQKLTPIIAILDSDSWRRFTTPI